MEGRVIRDAALLDHAEVVGGVGSWDWIPAEARLSWSANVFRLFELEPGEIEPTAEWFVERVHPDDRDRVRATVETMASGGREVFEYRFQLRDGRSRPMRTVVAEVEPYGDGAVHLLGLVQDLTAQRAAEQAAFATAAVSTALAAWPGFEPGVRDLLAAMGRALGSPLVTLWVRDEGLFRARCVWCDAGAGLDRLVEATRAWHPGPGSPGIGRAFASGRPSRVDGAAAVAAGRRGPMLRAEGLDTALVVPAVAGDEVLAAIELLDGRPLGESEELRGALDDIGRQIGQALSRWRGELTTPLLSAREIEVLQHAADGRSLEEIADELQVSPATIKRHFERAYARLDARDRTAAVAKAMRTGFVR